MKIAYQGIKGSYSESCAKEMFPECETISCKTFDECFEKAIQDNSVRSIIPESNKTTGNIGVEYLIFKYRLNIYAEHFFPIKHNLLSIKGSNLDNIKDVYSHAQALSQSSNFIRKNNFTRFLLMGKEILQPELKNDNYITSFLFKLKSKPAALYSALSGFAINGVNMTKLQSFPEKNSFSSFFFLCDIEGHIDDQKIKNSLEELGLHCEDMHVLGVFKSDKFRQK